jgi:hypothetical protein
MSRFEAPLGIVTNGLVLNLDAGDPDSYTRSQPPYVEVLVVAGGAGGGRGRGGGGGAGGLIYNSAYQITNAAAITVTVGAGGAGGSTNSSTAPNGSNSVFGSLTAIGGGGGAGTLAVANSALNGASGGSGGGGSGNGPSSGPGGIGGNGTAGQGFNGGTCFSDNASYTAGGGGGGAGGPGNNSVLNTAGSGAAGQQYSISGTPSFYAAGGGGGGDGSAIAGSGGSSIGGNGSASSTGGNATTNTGAGGGGGAANQNGGNGGSGIVIVRYPGLPAATGGTIAYLNGYTIHTFTTSGTFTPFLWNDVSGNGNNGTLVNGVTFNSYQNGGSLIFDGTDDKVSTSFGPTSGDFTICLWFKDNGSGAFGRIADRDYISGFWLGRNAGTANSWGGGILEASPPYGIFLTLDDGKWHFLTSIRSGTTHILYGDGIANTTSNTVSSTALSSTTLALGDWSSGNIQPFTGNIACCFYYNRALSTAEITQNYNATKARFGL